MWGSLAKRLPVKHGNVHSRKGDDPTRDGAFVILIGGPLADVVADDGQEILPIPADLDGAALDHVEIHLRGDSSSSGAPTVQLYNFTQAVDMLSTEVSIDVGENTSETATTPAVIDTDNNTVAKGDQIWINVTAAGTGAQGLTVILGFS